MSLDNFTGVYREYYDEKKIILKTEVFMINGKKKEGVYKKYYENGCELSSTDNSKRGNLSLTNSLGHLCFEVNYINDIKNGIFKLYYDNGQLKVLFFTEYVNYDFVEASTPTELLFLFFFFFLGFSSILLSSILSLHKYLGLSNLFIAFFAILYIFVEAFTSLFHTLPQILHLSSPCTKMFPLLYGFGFSLIINFSHFAVLFLHFEHIQLVLNSSTKYTL